MACANAEKTFGFKPSETMVPRYLKLATVLCFCLLTRLHPERPKLHTILAFLSAKGLTLSFCGLLVCSFQHFLHHFIHGAGLVETFK